MTAAAKIIFDCPLAAWQVALLAGAAAAVAFSFAHRDVRHVGRARRRAILALAAVALLMLTGLLLSPKLIRIWPDPQKPLCAILVDGSLSMKLTDTYAGAAAEWLAGKLPQAGNPGPSAVSREQVAKLLLAESPASWLGRLRKDFALAGWRFAGDVETLALGQEGSSYQVDERGHVTAIGDALKRCGGGAGGSRPRAIVLISDGASNRGDEPSEIARMVGLSGIPVHVVGLGNPEPPRDAKVLELLAPKTTLLGDELFLTARVATTGMGAARIPVQLFSEGRLLDEKQVVTLPSGRPVNVRFSSLPDRPGRRLLSVVIPTQEAEQDEKNNRAQAWVQVIERKIRILLIDRLPRWEFRFIRNVFERDPAVMLTVCLLRPGVGPISGAGYISRLPTDKKALAEYDLVILGDVGRRDMPDEFLNELADMVRNRGAALAVIAGRGGHYREMAGTAVAKILPVALEGVSAPPPGLRPFHVELTQEGASHLLTRLAGSEDATDNESAWAALPELHWAAGVAGLTRGAEALVVHPYQLAGASKLPLIAVQRVGAGKVMFCGIDETWRWRKIVGDKYHYRFWAQTIRWMAKKQFAEGDPRGRLSIDRNECRAGENVLVEAYCLGPDGFPVSDARVRVQIAREGGQVQQLSMAPAAGGWGIYQAVFTPTEPGSYQMQPIVSIYGEVPLESSVSLTVEPLDLEKNFLAQDRNTLTAIADAAGGEYFDISQIDRLPALLSGTIEKRFLTAEYSPCRHWAYYAVLSGLLGAAWLIRKRSGLA